MKIAALFRLLKSDILATLALSLPIIIANIGNVAMGQVDAIMIRSLGVNVIDAAGISNALFFLVAVLGIGTLSVIAPQVSAAVGMQDKRTVTKYLYAGIRLGGVIGIIIAGIIFALAFFLESLGQPPEVTALARPFLITLAVSVIPMMLFLSLKYFADGLSFTMVDMVITISAVMLNIFLNWLLIYGNWGFPALGLNGAGFATLTSRILMATAAFLYIFKSKDFAPYRTAFDENHLRPFYTKIVRMGFPAGMQWFFEGGAFASAVIMMGWLSKYHQAAHTIAIAPASVSYMMMAGIASAAAIRVGKARGENSRAGIVRAGTVAFLLTGIFMVLACLVFILFPYQLVALYIENPQDAPKVIPIAVSLMIIAGFFQLSDGIQVVGLGSLRGLEDVKVPTYITLLAYWVIGLPVGYILAFPLGLEAEGMWYGLTAGLTVSAILLTMRFYSLSAKVPLRWSPKMLRRQTAGVKS
ncbi:MAG: MATE family efflux transporter [Verrucomicrobia bacterium]|nr:MATE family efflux transporter [Cytophagales bacterium]